MKLSSVTEYDKILTEVSFALSHGELKNFNCFTCKKRKDHESAAKFLGCKEARDVPVFTSDEYKFYRCVGNFRDLNFIKYGRYAKLIRESVNPFGGAFIETPAKLVELCGLVDNLMADRNSKEANKNGK